jgi:hypothetical protein
VWKISANSQLYRQLTVGITEKHVQEVHCSDLLTIIQIDQYTIWLANQLAFGQLDDWLTNQMDLFSTANTLIQTRKVQNDENRTFSVYNTSIQTLYYFSVMSLSYRARNTLFIAHIMKVYPYF